LQKQLCTYRIKWVQAENFHVTLFFFGEIKSEQTNILQEFLSQTLKELSAFTFSFSGAGIFKDRKEPRILWLGIETSETLIKLKKEIDKTVSLLRFTTGEKPIHPHLTLGRFAPRQKISQALNITLCEFRVIEPLTYTVSKLTLFESKLSPTGAKYFPLATFPLKDTNTLA
jgi:2'-5' RNA ligase